MKLQTCIFLLFITVCTEGTELEFRVRIDVDWRLIDEYIYPVPLEIVQLDVYESLKPNVSKRGVLVNDKMKESVDDMNEVEMRETDDVNEVNEVQMYRTKAKMKDADRKNSIYYKFLTPNTWEKSDLEMRIILQRKGLKQIVLRRFKLPDQDKIHIIFGYMRYNKDVEISLLPDSDPIAEEDWKRKQAEIVATADQLRSDTLDFVVYTRTKKTYCQLQEKTALSALKEMSSNPDAASDSDIFKLAQRLRDFGWQYYYLAKYQATRMAEIGNAEIKSKLLIAIGHFVGYETILVEQQNEYSGYLSGEQAFRYSPTILVKQSDVLLKQRQDLEARLHATVVSVFEMVKAQLIHQDMNNRVVNKQPNATAPPAIAELSRRISEGLRVLSLAGNQTSLYNFKSGAIQQQRQTYGTNRTLPVPIFNSLAPNASGSLPQKLAMQQHKEQNGGKMIGRKPLLRARVGPYAMPAGRPAARIVAIQNGPARLPIQNRPARLVSVQNRHKEAGANLTKVAVENGGIRMVVPKNQKYDHVFLDFAHNPGQNSAPRITVFKQRK